jgi:hypothetical protein
MPGPWTARREYLDKRGGEGLPMISCAKGCLS